MARDHKLIVRMPVEGIAVGICDPSCDFYFRLNFETPEEVEARLQEMFDAHHDHPSVSVAS